MVCLTMVAGFAEDPMPTLQKDLVPETPGRSPNYWCTWATQNHMEGQGEAELDPILRRVAGIDKYHSDHLNEKVLFEDPGWLVDYFPKVREDLLVVVDYGWDIPVDGDVAYTNSTMQKSSTGRWIWGEMTPSTAWCQAWRRQERPG